MLHIVLVEPEIPSNTGNISRTCAVTGSALHLVRPLGFSTDDKSLKRAGLDYWHSLTLFYHDSIEELWAGYPDARFFYCSTHAKYRYDEVQFRDGDFLVFGKETAGLGEKILNPHADGRRTAVLESKQRGRDRRLRGAPAERFFRNALTFRPKMSHKLEKS